MFYSTFKFHDDSTNTFGFMESPAGIVLIEIRLGSIFKVHTNKHLILSLSLRQVLNPRRQKLNGVTRRHKERSQTDPFPSIFDTIYLIEMIFGTYNERSLYFQFIETTWYLFGFHGNHSYLIHVSSGCHFE